MDDNEMESFEFSNEIRNKESRSISDQNNEKMQFILSIDKRYTSAAKALFFGIAHIRNKKTFDSGHSSLTGTPKIFEEVFSLLTSQSFLRAIENGDVKAATKFLKSSWTFHARRYENSCVNSISRKFVLNTYNNLSFAERAILFVAKNRNVKVFSLIASALFLKAVKAGNKYSVKRFLNGSINERSMRFETLCVKPRDKKFIVNVDAFDKDCLLNSCISFFDWLEGIYIASKYESKFWFSSKETAAMLLKFEKIVNDVTENGWTSLHLALFQFQSKFESREQIILKYLLESGNFDVNALTNESETVLHFSCRCSVSNEQFTLFMKRLLQMHMVNANQRNSKGETALMIACKTGNVAAVRELLEWRDDDGERVIDISARDENGQTALSLAKQSNMAEIVAMIEKNLFLRAVENGDTETVKTYLTLAAIESNFEILYRRTETDTLNDHHMHNCEQMEIQSHENDQIEYSPRRRLNVANETEFTSKDFIASLDWLEAVAIARHNLYDGLPSKRFKAGIVTEISDKVSLTRSVWLEAITIAKDNSNEEMLNMLFNGDHCFHGFNENGQSILHQAVAEYLEAEYDSRKLKTIEILLISGKFNANVLNMLNKTVFEIICKITKYYINDEKSNRQIDDLLRVFLKNGIDLNGRNKSGETFLMLACKKGHTVMARSLLDCDSNGFVLDIDAVDNSGETALMKTERKHDSKIVADLLKFKFISAVKDENREIVKSMLSELLNRPTFDICVRPWSWDDNLDDSLVSRTTKSDIWLKTMYIAMDNDTKHSEEIRKHLLDFHIILIQAVEAGNYSFYQLMHEWKVVDKNLRLIELLLKSGKINANDRDVYGATALHWAEEEKLISLLIRYGADVNRKDNKGKTPLMPIFHLPGKVKFPVLRTLLEEAGSLVDLDSMDCNGRTALMHAVILHRSHDVELLLSKGASVNLSDHFGFTALHHALHGKINENFKYPRNSEELKKIKEIAILFDAEEHEHLFCTNEEWSEKRRKIVEMLLQKPDIDVNLLSIEKFSPLDIAEGQIPEIPSSIINALNKKGAVLNVFRQTKTQSKTDFQRDFTCMLTMTLSQLFEPLNAFHTENAYFVKERWMALIEALMKQNAPAIDQQGRTFLHLVAISFYHYGILLTNAHRLMYLADKIVDKLISLGCNVNEPDIYGRTPLHYANRVFWKLLISKGADASIKDKDGNCAMDKESFKSHNFFRFSRKIFDVVCEVISRKNETYFLRLLDNRHMEINIHCVDRNSIREFWRETSLETAFWEEGEHAFRHPLVEKITEEVTDLMNAIAKDIERQDPRFKIKPFLVGSSNEGTKIDKPDEFDFCFVLTEISELCEVSLSPELPTGFVHLKRMPKKVGETCDFDGFFGKDRILNTEKLTWEFTTILSNALFNINSKLSFEWILSYPTTYNRIHENVRKVSEIEMIKPLNFVTVDKISVDIVPCIHVDGWWPDEAISNVSEEIKKFGCNFVFDGPQKLYPWVPYSESCARISFSKAESDMIKQSCDNAREAYMIGKMMTENSDFKCDASNYILKNCLLYCFEAVSPSPEKASQLGLSLEEMKSKFDQMDRYLWLKCLLKCRLEFVAQDFCPSYFLPTFSNCTLIYESRYLKKGSSDWIINHKSTFPRSCVVACLLYRFALNDISESSYQLPAPDPLWEHFDRKQLIVSLCEIAYK